MVAAALAADGHLGELRPGQLRDPAPYIALFAVGFLGQPRRVVAYPLHLQGLNIWVSVSAYFIGISMIIFLVNVIWSYLFVREPALANPWGSKSVEWQLPSPVPVHDFERMPVFDADPYPYGEPVTAPAGAPAPAGGQV